VKGLYKSITNQATSATH